MNVIGPFLLSKLLIPSLKNTAPASSRIVNIASTYAGDLYLDDLQYKKRDYEKNEAYRRAKALNRILNKALADDLAKDPSTKHILCNACHPGVINTGLLDDLGFSSGRESSEGAQTPVFLATSPEVEGKTGLFWNNRSQSHCKFSQDAQTIALACKEIHNLILPTSSL